MAISSYLQPHLQARPAPTSLEDCTRELDASERRYRLLVEQLNDLVIHRGLDRRLQFVSPSYCAAFGKCEDQLLGCAFVPPIHEEDRRHEEDAWQTVLAPPYVARYEERLLTVDGW